MSAFGTVSVSSVVTRPPKGYSRARAVLNKPSLVLGRLVHLPGQSSALWPKRLAAKNRRLHTTPARSDHPATALQPGSSASEEEHKFLVAVSPTIQPHRISHPGRVGAPQTLYVPKNESGSTCPRNGPTWPPFYKLRTVKFPSPYFYLAGFINDKSVIAGLLDNISERHRRRAEGDMCSGKQKIFWKTNAEFIHSEAPSREQPRRTSRATSTRDASTASAALLKKPRKAAVSLSTSNADLARIFPLSFGGPGQTAVTASAQPNLTEKLRRLPQKLR